MRPQALREEIDARRDEIAAPSADRTRWDHSLRVLFDGYSLENWTDFNYGKCHTYEILMPRGQLALSGSLEDEQQLLRNLGGSRASLLLKLSAIAPYYLISVVERYLDDRSGSIHERYERARNEEERGLWTIASAFAEQHGFSAIDLESLSMPIPEIEMELAEPGTTTVYNCLFEDQANNAPLPVPSASDEIEKHSSAT